MDIFRSLSATLLALIHVNSRRLCFYIYEWNVVCFLIMEFSFLPVSITNKETMQIHVHVNIEC